MSKEYLLTEMHYATAAVFATTELNRSDPHIFNRILSIMRNDRLANSKGMSIIDWCLVQIKYARDTLNNEEKANWLNRAAQYLKKYRYEKYVRHMIYNK